MNTVETLCKSGDIHKFIKGRIQAYFGPSGDSIVSFVEKEGRVFFNLVAKVENKGVSIDFSMIPSVEAEYLEYYVLSELEDALELPSKLKNSYETMLDEEFKKVASRIKKCKKQESKVKILMELSPLHRDIFIFSKHGKCIAELLPKEE